MKTSLQRTKYQSETKQIMKIKMNAVGFVVTKLVMTMHATLKREQCVSLLNKMK